MGKKPVYASEEDLQQVKALLQGEAASAKQAGQRAAQDVRQELLAEISKVSAALSEHSGAAKSATDRVASDAAAHAKGCTDQVRSELTELVEASGQKVADTQRRIDAQLQQLDDSLKATMAEELMALTQQVEEEITSVKTELMAGMEKWAKEAAEALVAQRKEVDASIERLREEIASKDEAGRQFASDECKKYAEEQKKVDTRQDEKSDRAQSEIWLKIERLDELVQEVRDNAKEQIDSVDTRATDGITELRKEAETKITGLSEQAVKLHDAVSEVENLSTRRVDWVIRNVSKRIRPPSASKACLHTSWFSPKFDMAGAHGLQLELQLFRDADPPVEGQAAGDCAAFLWACKGMNLVYKLYIGTKSAQLEKVFNGRVPYGTKRLCFLKDMINREEDTLRVSIEILEAVREIEHPVKPPPPPAEGVVLSEEDERMKPLEGKVVFRRHVNNRMLDQVKTQVENMRSRMVRRVEWRLEQASLLRRCFSSGEPMCSVAFAAAGVEGMQLMFYPSGYQGCTDGFCSLFLYAQAGTMLKYTLYAGSHRRDATNFFEDAGAFGRTNFCRFESVVEQDTDSIFLAIEIEEAHQDVTARVAHPIVAPGDRRSQAQIDAALPQAVESVVKMQRAPGKLNGGLEERRVLPSLWTAKSLGERSGPNDLQSFDDLKSSRSGGAGPSRRQSAAAFADPSSPASTGYGAASSPLSVSRSMPSLTKELSGTSELPALSRSSGDWAGSGIAPKKVRSAGKAKRSLNSTMQVLEPGGNAH